MIDYTILVADRISRFDKTMLDYLPRGVNCHADSLAKVLGTEVSVKNTKKLQSSDFEAFVYEKDKQTPNFSLNRFVKGWLISLFPFTRLFGIAHFLEGKSVVIIGAVTDDTRVDEVPLIKVVDLRFTEIASTSIEKVGGKCLKFDHLSLWARMELKAMEHEFRCNYAIGKRYELKVK
ncbi:hypothetical protein GIB67_012593 [Kingdonia uniflora]|uniref:Large ribosomal subunit protein uL15/eL18 domain-containing protein n=1 Tax=Kingdonia uniflora TaxID=39325 RepID=A0A7J7NES9_9MAGN|nr:hypothetical protein GIB67_012593 [Kingdonia uniflora]